VRDPAKVREAVAQGWNQRRVRKAWSVENGESGERWPRRLALRFEGPQGVKRYTMVFAKRDGRWIIDNWFEPREITRHYPSVTLPPATPAKPPAAKSPAVKPPAAKPTPKPPAAASTPKPPAATPTPKR
jgi:hypothetical protein